MRSDTLGYLLIPFCSLFFVIFYWTESKRGFLLSLAGSIIISASMASASKVQHGVFLGKFLVKSTATDADLASDLTSDIQQKRDLFDQKIPELAASSA